MIKKIVLEGDYARLEPIGEAHREGLIAAINDGRLFELFVTMVPHPDNIDAFIGNAIAAHNNGEGLTFVTIDKQSNKVAGSTRFMNADIAHKKVEIGFTFLGRSYQRSKLNTDAKLLMLSHAFETLAMSRIEFLTDYLNQSSRNAILRLGAKQEGVLRNHKQMANGRVRDSVIFSVIANEWNGVKQNLEYKLSR